MQHACQAAPVTTGWSAGATALPGRPI